MAITRTPMIDDDGSGTTGTIINNAWKTELYNQIDGAIGAIDVVASVPFNASMFGVYPSGAWTVTSGNVITLAYSRTGGTGVVTMQLANTVITGTPLLLSVAPAITAARRTVGTARLTIGGVLELAAAYFEVADGKIYLQRVGQNWSAGTLADMSMTIPIFYT